MHSDMHLDSISRINITRIYLWVIRIYNKHIWILDEVPLMAIPLMRV